MKKLLPDQIPKLLPDESSGSVNKLESSQNIEDSNSEETEKLTEKIIDSVEEKV